MDLKPGELLHRLWLRLALEDVGSSQFILRRLEHRNRTAQSSVLSPDGPVVSLTTYGKRTDTVYLTLESIALGALLPSRLILWMDEEDRFRSRPESLRRLESRGLEVRLTANYGPHKKYYPYLESSTALDLPLATADDDALYPVGWLKGLAASYRQHPALVSCYRAHVVKFEGDGFAPYVTWERCRSTEPSFLNFATGVSGTIYPPAFQAQLKAAGLGFVDVCPRADDVWLHREAMRGGFKVKQLKAWEQSFPELPGTQDVGLVLENVHGSQNDLQIQQTYTAEDIAFLKAHAVNFPSADSPSGSSAESSSASTRSPAAHSNRYNGDLSEREEVPPQNRVPIAGLQAGELQHRVWLELASLDLNSLGMCVQGLERRNRSKRDPVVAPNGPVVSMTTYGKRLDSVYLPLETIGRGALLPSRLILWLDEESSYAHRPDSLRRLEDRGLEVKLSARFGPHTKYYPYLESSTDLDLPLVTADDDTLYPRGWLEQLAAGHRANPGMVHCCRAHVIELEGPGFAPYIRWQRCRSTVPSILNFATGVSGVIYPPALQRRLKSAGLEFMRLCPKADDIWLHLQAIRNGFKVQQLKAWEQSFPVMPGTQGTGLIQGNVHGSQNDVQIRQTYTEEDIARLRATV